MLVVGAGVEGARAFVDQLLEAVVFDRISGDQILELAGVDSVHTDVDHIVGTRLGESRRREEQSKQAENNRSSAHESGTERQPKARGCPEAPPTAPMRLVSLRVARVAKTGGSAISHMIGEVLAPDPASKDAGSQVL